MDETNELAMQTWKLLKPKKIDNCKVLTRKLLAFDVKTIHKEMHTQLAIYE